MTSKKSGLENSQRKLKTEQELPQELPKRGKGFADF